MFAAVIAGRPKKSVCVGGGHEGVKRDRADGDHRRSRSVEMLIRSRVFGVAVGLSPLCDLHVYAIRSRRRGNNRKRRLYDRLGHGAVRRAPAIFNYLPSYGFRGGGGGRDEGGWIVRGERPRSGNGGGRLRATVITDRIPGAIILFITRRTDGPF